MPRRRRLVIEGCPLHIVQRGNNRAPCFVADADRTFYLAQLARALARFHCGLHAYCLMTNHVHLLLTPPSAEACGGLMKYIGQLHSQYMNRKYRRTGGLWEGRFRSSVVQSESYLLACYRYIELNPVRAAIVERPEDYYWSSYRMNVRGATHGLITPHREYLRLGMTDEERGCAYAELIGSGLEDAQLAQIRFAVNSGQALA